MRKTLLSALASCLVFASCGGNSSPENSLPVMNSNAADTKVVERVDRRLDGGGGGGREENLTVAQQVSLNQAEQTQNATGVERKIIRNGDLTLESDAPEDAMRKISSIAETKGGFVVETQQSTNDSTANKRDTVTMTVRVPAAKFDETLDEIRKTASRLIVENVKGEDVTEEFIDIEARLKAKKALEAQFLEIMKQAKSVDDALSVQTQLASVRGEIEQIEGRKRFLESQTSLSTIKIKLQTPNVFSPKSSGFFYQLGEAVSKGFDSALGFILGLITFLIAILPFLLTIVLPLYLVVRYLLRKRKMEKTPIEIIKEELKNE